MALSDRRLPLASKKFLAFLIGEITWKLVLVATLYFLRQDFKEMGVWAWWFMMSVVVTAGFLEIGYIGGQAWLDRYVHMAEVVRNPKEDPKED
jgi:hypothetical protein